MTYETLTLSKEALQIIVNVPQLPKDDRETVKLALSSIELDESLTSQNKRLIGRDQNGELVFKNEPS